MPLPGVGRWHFFISGLPTSNTPPRGSRMCRRGVALYPRYSNLHRRECDLSIEPPKIGSTNSRPRLNSGRIAPSWPKRDSVSLKNRFNKSQRNTSAPCQGKYWTERAEWRRRHVIRITAHVENPKVIAAFTETP